MGAVPDDRRFFIVVSIKCEINSLIQHKLYQIEMNR